MEPSADDWKIVVSGTDRTLLVDNQTPWPVTVNFTVAGVTVRTDKVSPRKRAKGK